jgi:nitroimidazol reductase NimA-like FMN-containing flavoprotein (pyridoxamine 5'-phosphate oxidase superfamily)
MRRKQCEIKSVEAIEEILGRARVGRLATSGADGFPYITPVNYVWWNGSIYFHCAHQGEKIENIRRSNKVCFEVDIPLAYLGLEYDRKRPTCQVHQFYHCVIIRGKAEIVNDLQEKIDALNALVAVHEDTDNFDKVTAESKGLKPCCVVAVRVESISGKSDLAQKMNAEDREKVARYLLQRDLPGDREAADLIGK